MWEWIQGGENSWDALSCRSLSAKEPLLIGLFWERIQNKGLMCGNGYRYRVVKTHGMP